MSGERSQDEGERYGISEPHGYAKAMSYYEKLKLGSFCHIDALYQSGLKQCPFRHQK
jgi:hypothetical protein